MKYIFLSLFIILFLTSCGSSGSSKSLFNDKEKEFLDYLFKTKYLWYDKITPSDYSNFTDPNDMIDSYKYKKLDKWSYSQTFKEYEDFSSQSSDGFGCQYQNTTIKNILIDSPCEKAGLLRGDEVLLLDHNDITNQSYKDAMNNLGHEYTFTIQRLENNSYKTMDIKITPKKFSYKVSKKLIFKQTSNNKNIGYFIYDSFSALSTIEIDEAFKYFKNNNIQELIIDLRYNSGGAVNTALYLLDHIQKNYIGETVLSIEFNDKNTDENYNEYFQYNKDSIDISKIIFLTSKNTASASELIINSLKPYMDVITIGDTTSGKPTGMRGESLTGDLIYWLINFSFKNANGEGDFYDGIQATCGTSDDINIQRTDINDKLLNNALFYLKNSYCNNYAANITNNDFVKLDSNYTNSKLEVKNLPKQINHNTTLEFDVKITINNKIASNITLAYGPSGMKIDNTGHVTWKANEIMFQKQETFNFGFQTSNTLNTFDASIIVNDNNRSFPIARSSIGVPYTNNSLYVGDFDEDNKSELLSLGEFSFVYNLEYNGTTYIQDWLYPFSMPVKGRLNKAIAVDINKDDKNEILIISKKGISYIKNRDELASVLYKLPSSSYYNDEIRDATVGDIDNDGIDEVIFIMENNSSLKLLAYEINTKKEKLNITLSDNPRAIVVGNIDHDDALEIVLSNGYVYDGKSGVLQWQNSSEFGNIITLGDLNNNGINEIIATSAWEKPSVYSGITKSSLWEIDKTDICSMYSDNIDNDPQDELIIGDCQYGDVTVYDASNNPAIQQSKWSNTEPGSISITSGDINNDGKKELIWGNGTTSSGKDILVIAEQNDTQVWYNKNPSQLDSFISSGWATISSNNQQAVFVVPRTNNGYKGQRIVTMNDKGDLTISQDIQSNWDRSLHSAISDYNHDGKSELFLATSNTYDGKLNVLQLDDFSTIYDAYGGEYENTIKEIETKDLNNDTYDDAIFVDNKKLIVSDIYNQTILWEQTFDSLINDIEIINNTNIVVSTYNNISIWHKNGDSYIKKASLANRCTRIEKIKFKDFQTDSIICYKDTYTNTNTFSILDSNLSVLWSFNIDKKVQDFTVEPSINNNSNILVSSLIGDYSDGYNTQFLLISAKNGKIIWKSLALPGEMYDRSIHYIPDNLNNKRITFATKNVMYISK